MPDNAIAERRLRWVVDSPASLRLDKRLASVFPEFSRVRLQALIAEGNVLVDGRPAQASERLKIGQEVQITVPPPADVGIVPEHIPLDILFEDDDLIVLNKEAGMVVHPGAGHSTGTLVHALMAHGPLSSIGGELRPGIVHRLDAGTSGVMVVAKTDTAHRHLARQFEVHSNERCYLAVVHKVPRVDRGMIRSFIGRDPVNRQKFASVAIPEQDEEEDELLSRGKEAITWWEALARGDRVSLVQCRLETGRTHQIRVHLSEAGHPLVGDSTYSRRDCTPPKQLRALTEGLKRPLLHAWFLGIDHPKTGERLAFLVPPPDDVQEFCREAGLVIPAKPRPPAKLH
jgi:23S rRNA pseudouridine1911/1915/1917 synthase